MRNVLIKDTLKEIIKSRKRFLSIFLIILLGAGFFAGIKAISPDMKKAADNYFDESNFMDFRLLSTLGMTEDDIEEIKKIPGVNNVEPQVSIDAIIQIKDKESVVKLHTLPLDKIKNGEEYLNKVKLIDGRLPSTQDECVIDSGLTEYSGFNIGDTLQVEVPDQNIKDSLKVESFKIVGVVTSPLYISLDRGTSSLGSGKIIAYVYVPDIAVSTDVYTEIYVSIEGSKVYETFSNGYKEFIDTYKVSLEELGKIRKDIRYDEIVTKGKEELDKAKEELDKQRSEAQKKISDSREKIKKAEIDLNNAERELVKSEKEANEKFSQAEELLNNGKLEFNEKEKEFNEQKNKYEPIINSATTAIQGLEYSLSTLETLISKNEEVIIQKQELISSNKIEIENLRESLGNISEDEKVEVLANIVKLENENNELSNQINLRKKENEYMRAGKESLNEKIPVLKATLDENIQKLNDANTAINNARNELTNKEIELNNSKQEAYAKINSGKYSIQTARNEIEKNKELLDSEEKNADIKLQEAEENIRLARQKLEEVKEPKWYVLDRNMNAGYYSYNQDSDRIAAIARVFPVMFFIVAALVSLTSMTRMVEEQRGQIGILKALGYSKYKIALKYIIYSLLATFLGAVIGISIGFVLLPTIVFNVYGMLYNMPPTVTEFNVKYAILAILLSILCTTIATIFACIKELKETPSTLMRPKAPKMGKRILLEKIPFIWNKLNFTMKVTARNIFRYKKRFLMTIIGIGGCTGLLLVGFGLKDSISSMLPLQFNNIFNYKLDISLKDNYTKEELSKINETINSIPEIKDYQFINEHAITFEKGGVQKEGQIVVVDDTEKFKKYINLQDRKSKTKITFNKDSVILTEKMANMLNVKVGDTINIKNSDEDTVEVIVTDITENYIYHYMYISSQKYEQIYNEKVNNNKVIANIQEDIDDTRKSGITATLLENKNLTNAAFTFDTFDMFDDAMKSLNSVVLILIVSAGLLAFVVLYNLSNINISERVRELATIKVLGFYDREVTSYVYRENIILTIIGSLLGLVIGYFLNDFIITTCEVDLVMFGRVIKVISYIFALIITFVFSTIVNIATHFTLKKIDMIESLKSVE